MADWDRDGHQDIVARNERRRRPLAVPGPEQRGTHQPPVQIGNGWAGYTPFGITDWDRDGHQDIVARHDSSGDLWLYPGESRRGYTSRAPVRIGNGW